MKHTEYAFGRYEADIAAVAEKYNLNLNGLEVESFSPTGLAILVESMGESRFKVHINLQENRIIAVQKLGAESVDEIVFAKYKNFMK